MIDAGDITTTATWWKASNLNSGVGPFSAHSFPSPPG